MKCVRKMTAEWSLALRRNYILFLLNITSGMLGDINEFF